jgi:hypothetical protein
LVSPGEYMMRHLKVRSLRYVLAFGLTFIAAPSVLRATPYASNVAIGGGGTSVSFILNEPTDSLNYIINGGAPQASTDGLGKGNHTFTIPAGATFSIVADKTSAVGYTVPLGGGAQIAAVAANGLSQATNQSGTNIISDDTSSLSRYNSPRGVSVSLNPNTSNFGTVYINNTAGGTLTGGNVVGPNTAVNVGRTLTGKGLYALHADETDAYGNGDAAVNPTNIDTFPAFATAVNQYGTSVSNSAYRIRVGDDGTIWASDYSDVNGQLFQIQSNLTGGATTSTNIFAGFGGPPQPTASDGTTVQPTADGTGLGPDPGCTGALRGCTPTHQNHGSISSSWATGSLAGGNLVVYTLDEDLDSAHFGGTGANSQSDRNSVWQYNIGGSIPSGGYTANPNAQLAAGAPTPAAPTVPNGLIGDFGPGGIVADMTRGPDGKFYLAQNRSAGNQPGLMVYDSTGQNVLFNSLQASKTLLGDPNAVDIFTGVGGIDVSPDGKYLATVEIDNDIVVVPLVNGIPDIANRVIVDAGTNGGNGRDISFDAADNLYYVSSGQGMYRVLSPGGHSKTTLTWNGSTYSFVDQTIGASLAGDYNNDGKVDAADYVVWRNGGSPVPNSVADYNTWRANFGAHSGSGSSLGGSAAVPEPGCLALAMLGLLAVGGCRKRLA